MKTVPVKLLRPENTLRKANTDRMYAKCSVDDVQRLCSLFGPDEVLFLSESRTPLGLAVANLQAPILMHLDYKVRLNDHSFVHVVGTGHNLMRMVQYHGKIRMVIFVNVTFTIGKLQIFVVVGTVYRW